MKLSGLIIGRARAACPRTEQSSGAGVSLCRDPQQRRGGDLPAVSATQSLQAGAVALPHNRAQEVLLIGISVDAGAFLDCGEVSRATNPGLVAVVRASASDAPTATATGVVARAYDSVHR